jgi:HK97 gp10 family phage protein
VAADLEGYAELERKLAALASPKEGAAALRAAVRKPARVVMNRAKANIARISPGETPYHRTYKGREVGAGFAARSLRVVISLAKNRSSVSARIGVRREAFYATQFFEVGTAYLPAQPWLVPAFESSIATMTRGVGEVLKAHIEKIAKRRSAVSSGASR